MRRTLSLLALLAIVGCGCGEVRSESENPGGVDLCEINPTGRCSGDCAFEPPSDVDCTSACQHLAEICESGCAGQCESIGLDPTLCGVVCEETKAQRCTNLIFGCYDQNDICESVSDCVANGG